MSAVDDVKARLDLVTVIGQAVTLKKAGRNYTALCPFHAEKHPSFVVFPEAQSWHCFGACGEGGDIFTFVQKHRNVDFREALELLAKEAGVELESHDRTSTDDPLYGLLNATAEYFHTNLRKPSIGGQALTYLLESRGLTTDTLRKFQIGYAQDSWTALVDHLHGLGYTDEQLWAAGVAGKSEKSGRPYDFFRNRIVFPVSDMQGRVVGFGGRAIKADQQPKYLNSPQSQVFDKGRLLYGMYESKADIAAQKAVIVVEGYMDKVTAHQQGFTNTVAQMGTALTDAQCKLMARYTKQIILSLDGDNAGQNAMMKDIEALFRQVEQMLLDIRVLNLPEGRDPDDVLRTDYALYKQLVESAAPVHEYVINRVSKDVTDKTPVVERQKIATGILPVLVAAETELMRQNNLKTLALKLRLPENSLLDLLKPTRRILDTVVSNGSGTTLGLEVLRAVILNPEWLSDVKRYMRRMKLTPLVSDDFSEKALQRLYNNWNDALSSWEHTFQENMLELITDEDRQVYQTVLSNRETIDYYDMQDAVLRMRKTRLELRNREIAGLVDSQAEFRENANQIALIWNEIRE